MKRFLVALFVLAISTGAEAVERCFWCKYDAGTNWMSCTENEEPDHYFGHRNCRSDGGGCMTWGSSCLVGDTGCTPWCAQEDESWRKPGYLAIDPRDAGLMLALQAQVVRVDYGRAWPVVFHTAGWTATSQMDQPDASTIVVVTTYTRK